MLVFGALPLFAGIVSGTLAWSEVLSTNICITEVSSTTSTLLI